VSALIRGDAGAALTDARTAATANPVSVDPLFLLSRIYAAERKPAQARSELVRAVRTQPSNPATWSELGRYDLDHHQTTAAVVELQQAHILHPASGSIATALQQARAQPPAGAAQPVVPAAP
jgi:cytochrome c-type biogenesis protein CcmH/NrfG